MATNNFNNISFISALLVLCLFVQTTSSDFASDKARCSDKLMGLATCLTYVQGNAKAPTPDCCNGLQSVIQKSPECLCILVKDHDDPQLGLQINITLALQLPAACHVPANISECPRLLNLSSNSTDAQIFEQTANSTASQRKGDSSTNDAAAASSNPNGSPRNGRTYWLLTFEKIEWFVRVQEMSAAVFVSMLLPLLFFT